MWCNLRDAKGTCLSRSLARAHLYYVVIITAIYYVCNIIIYNNTITGACICGSSGIPSSLASCVKFTRVVIAHSELISESMSFLFLYDFAVECEAKKNAQNVWSFPFSESHFRHNLVSTMALTNTELYYYLYKSFRTTIRMSDRLTGRMNETIL